MALARQQVYQLLKDESGLRPATAKSVGAARSAHSTRDKKTTGANTGRPRDAEARRQ
jgi:hypothetical protein